MKALERLRVITRREQSARDLADELQFHIDRQAEENMAAGMTPRAARLAALREFGGVEALKDECRSARGLDWLEHLGQDLRFALRNCRRKPGFAAAVIALTAVGIGAASAVFSVVDRVLFRPLPYAASSELVSVGIRIPWLEYDFLTAGSYLEVRRNPGPLAAMTSWGGIAECDLTGDAPQRLSCARAESSFLPVLGIQPAAGRNFTTVEDQPNAPPVALISHALWKTRFGGQPDAIGRQLELDGQRVRVVGVLPADFVLPTLDRADVLLPEALPANPASGARPVRVYGRLRAGVTAPQARQMLLSGAPRFLSDVPPHVRKQLEFRVLSLRDTQAGDFRAASWTLFGAVLAMLLIACANAANLLLARSVARRRELAIRVALGAGRSRMVRQTLAETLLLSLAGGAAGYGVAQALLRFFVVIAPAGIPHLTDASLDLRVLLFGVAASVCCGILFGVAPALYAPSPALLTGGRVAGSAGLLARRFLVGAQLAISLALLACAGILLQSLWNREAVALGIRAERVVTAQFTLGPRYAAAPSRAAFYESLESRLRRLPGVEAVALTDTLPPGGAPRSQPFFALRAQGQPPPDEGTPGIVVWRAITPDYFRALGIPILRGRAFTEDDRRPAERSMIISDAYARRLFGDGDPLGRKISRSPGDARWYTVVGVVGDARNGGLTDGYDPEYYLVRRRGAEGYEDAPPRTAVILRGGAARAAMDGWLRSEIAALDPGLPAVIRTFREEVQELAARPRFQAMLLALFAGMGLLVAAFGLYGLASFLVAQREREFGVRLALGATPRGIVKTVLADAAGWTAGGLFFGLLGAVLAARSLRALLFHVSPADPWAYIAAAVVLGAVALGAAVVPARRAGRVDPAVALRHD